MGDGVLNHNSLKDFSGFYLNFNTFHPLFQKLLEIDVKFKLQKYAACQDLPTLQFLTHLYELLASFGIRRPSVNF
jgi:surface polysaccharide O-acyltransferase-like enzyme